MSYLVRSSKFRHVFGEPKKGVSWSGVKAENTTPEAHLLKGNTKFFGVSWAAGGGGSLAIINLDKPARLPGTVPHLGGHKGKVLDFDFCPFDEYQVASGSDDCTANVWQIPEGGLTETLTDPLVKLTGHQKKVHIVKYHPTADGILTTASHDHTIKIWDIANSKATSSFDDTFKEVIWSVSWNKQGNEFVTTSKDKLARILDPRAGSTVNSWQPHEGGKPCKAIWASNLDKIVTIGFSKQSDRQVMMWDPRNLESPLNSVSVDVGAGMYMGEYDEDNSILYMGDKGGSSIKYFELIGEEPHIFSLSASSFAKPQKGICKLPKLAGDVMKCEVNTMLRLHTDGVDLVPFKVPRKSSEFQDDLFPETRAPKAAMTAEEWLGGANKDPIMMSAKPGEGLDAAPRKVMKTAFQLQKEVEEKDAKIAELEAKVAALEAKLG